MYTPPPSLELLTPAPCSMVNPSSSASLRYTPRTAAEVAWAPGTPWMRVAPGPSTAITLMGRATTTRVGWPSDRVDTVEEPKL